jgi:uncharacterized OB-fold protein
MDKMRKQKPKIIPSEYIPEVGSHVEAIDGKDYLIANDAMYTFYQRTKGELSPFFLGLRDDKILLGCKCSNCDLVRVPPFLTHCPDCNFAPTQLVEVGQAGVMLSTPPITYFATALFQHMAPYGRGRVVFEGADTALSVNLYTTSGIMVPGIITKGTRVKLVFKDQRVGEMTDVFCVPAGELTPHQLEKKGLQESEINWEAPVAPELPVPCETDVGLFKKAREVIQSIFDEMNQNKRARKDIRGWNRNISVKMRGGEFGIQIRDSNIVLIEQPFPNPDFVMVCEDPKTLIDGLSYKGAITDSVINKKLWISKNLEFNTIFKLDRMARSVARSKKA